jgi:hypothetical protein
MAKNVGKICLFLSVVTILFVSSCKKTTPPPPPSKATPEVEQKSDEIPPPPSEQEAPAATESEQKSTEPAKVEPNEAAAPAGMASLDIKLPKPVFIGTPELVSVTNLEKPTGKLRGLFYVPEGTTNVALNKPVTCNQEPIIGDLGMITDGDKEAGDGSFVEIGPGVTYVTIDLEAQYNIYAILMWHYHQQARVYFDVIIQVSDDPDFIKDVKTIFNNDDDNTAGQGAGTDKNYTETFEGRLFDTKGVKGRYVRLYSNGNSGNDLNHYIEVAVYGKPAE